MQRAEEGAHAVDGERFFAVVGECDFVGVGEGGEFAGVGEADAGLCASDSCEESATKKALRINDEIVFIFAQVFEEGHEEFARGGPIPPCGEFFTVEEDGFIECVVSLDECGIGRVYEPVDFSVRVSTMEITQEGEGGGDVAEGRGFDNEDSLGRFFGCEGMQGTEDSTGGMLLAPRLGQKHGTRFDIRTDIRTRVI